MSTLISFPSPLPLSAVKGFVLPSQQAGDYKKVCNLMWNTGYIWSLKSLYFNVMELHQFPHSKLLCNLAELFYVQGVSRSANLFLERHCSLLFSVWFVCFTKGQLQGGKRLLTLEALPAIPTLQPLRNSCQNNSSSLDPLGHLGENKHLPTAGNAHSSEPPCCQHLSHNFSECSSFLDSLSWQWVHYLTF